jgi:hypothetical protein
MLPLAGRMFDGGRSKKGPQRDHDFRDCGFSGWFSACWFFPMHFARLWIATDVIDNE